MNTITVVGRLTAEPEDKTFNEDSICKFRLAVDNRDKDKMFINVATFGKVAEANMKHLEKGRQVAVSGRLTQSQWEDTHGQKRESFEIAASQVTWL